MRAKTTNLKINAAKKTVKNPTTWQVVFLMATVYFAIVEGLI